MGINDYFNVRLIEEFAIKPEIKGLSKEERLNLLDDLFKKEYQGKVVSLNMLEKELFVQTTSVTRAHFGIYHKGGSFKGFMTKLNISASGGYLPLIANSEYVRSADETKPRQNKFHRNTLKWHYFAKEILCEGERFRVQVDVRESKQHEYIVYNVGMNPIVRKIEKENQLETNKKREPANSAPMKATDLRSTTAPASIPCDDIIPHKVSEVKRENKKSLMSLIAEAMGRSKTPVTPKEFIEKER